MGKQWLSIRLPLNLKRPVGASTGDFSPLIDQSTGNTPRLVHGRAHGFEIALFNGDPSDTNTILDDTSGFSGVTFEIKTVTAGVIDAAIAAVFSKTVPASEFNANLKRPEWDNDTPNPGSPNTYHLVCTALDTQIGALDMTNAVANELDFALCITGVNPTYGRVPLGRALIKVVKDGATGAGSGVAPLASYTLTNDEIYALARGCIQAGENPNGASFSLFDRGGTNNGLLLFVEMEDGAPVLRQVPIQRA